MSMKQCPYKMESFQKIWGKTSVSMKIYIPVAALVVILMGYWWLWHQSADQVREEVTEWVAEEREAGRTADYDSFTVRGFPYRMQINFENVHLGDPEAGWNWQVDELTGFVLPYRLTHVVLVATGDQRLEFMRLERREVVEGLADNMRASIVLNARGDLERFGLEISTLAFNRNIFFDNGGLDRNEDISVDSFQLNSRRIRDGDGLPNQGRHHAVMLQLANMNWLNHPYEGLGPDISFVESRILMAGIPRTGLGSLSSEFLQEWDENEGVFFLDEAAIHWGEIDLAVNGVLELDNRHRPEGEMTVLVGGHGRAIDALVAGGAMESQYADLAKTVLDVIAAIGGDPQGRIRAPIRLEGGAVHLGPAELMDLEPLY